MILVASSPFFQKILGRNKHPHPLIFMKGVRYDDLLAIVDFLYRGEANVFQENLDSFLAIAEELQLKGLTGKIGGRVEEDEKPLPSTFLSAKTKIPSFKRPAAPTGENGTIAIPGNFSGDFEELDERVKSLMEKSQNRTANGLCFADRCKACGKEGYGRNIKDHIEANHLEGIVIPCNLCDKTFRSRNGLRLHKIQH